MIRLKFYLIFILLNVSFNCFGKIHYGVDLSHHNVVLNWKKVDASFIYLKASEGSTIKDSKFDNFVIQAQKHKILVGAYHFMTTSSSAKKQFENFRKIVDKHNMNLIPVLDIERQTKGYKLSTSKLRKEVRIFVNLCKKHYKTSPIIYCSQAFYTKYFLGYFDDCMYWCGDVNYPALLPHVIHQKYIKKVPGIKGKVDYNILNCKLKEICL